MTEVLSGQPRCIWSRPALVLAVVVLLTSTTAPASVRIASLDLADDDDVLRRAEAVLLGDAIRRACRDVLPAASYVVMTRDNIFQLLPPDVSLADCTGECAVQTGRNLGARYLLTGELLSIRGSLRVTLDLYDTKSANLIGTTQASGDDVVALERSLVERGTSLLMVLPGAAPDHAGIESEANQRWRDMRSSRNRSNWILNIATVGAAGTAVWFHMAGASSYQEHLDATNSVDADASWDDYQSALSTRDLLAGVAGGFLLWRTLRAFGDVPSLDEVRKSLVEKRRLRASVNPTSHGLQFVIHTKF